MCNYCVEEDNPYLTTGIIIFPVILQNNKALWPTRAKKSTHLLWNHTVVQLKATV